MSIGDLINQMTWFEVLAWVPIGLIISALLTGVWWRVYEKMADRAFANAVPKSVLATALEAAWFVGGAMIVTISWGLWFAWLITAPGYKAFG